VVVGCFYIDVHLLHLNNDYLLITCLLNAMTVGVMFQRTRLKHGDEIHVVKRTADITNSEFVAVLILSYILLC